MTRVIWKHILNPLIKTNTTEVRVPHGSKILHVGRDPQDSICIWIEQDDIDIHTEPLDGVKWDFIVLGTGHILPEEAMKYIGTVLQLPFVWHVYKME